jgi:phage portal protein BeeE
MSQRNGRMVPSSSDTSQNSKTLAGICRTMSEILNEKHIKIQAVWSKVRLLQGGFTSMPELAMNKVAQINLGCIHANNELVPWLP